MDGGSVELPSYVLCFAVADRLKTTPMDVSYVLDMDADDRAPVYWVQAAINMMTAEAELRKRREDAEMSDASKKRAKGRNRGALGRGG